MKALKSLRRKHVNQNKSDDNSSTTSNSIQDASAKLQQRFSRRFSGHNDKRKSDESKSVSQIPNGALEPKSSHNDGPTIRSDEKLVNNHDTEPAPEIAHQKEEEELSTAKLNGHANHASTEESERIFVTKNEERLDSTLPTSSTGVRAPLKEPVTVTKQNGIQYADHKAHGRVSKKLILNAFVEMCSGHQSPGLWRHPNDQSRRFNEIKYWMDLAQLLEEGKFHGIFIADVLGGYDVYGGPKNLRPAIVSGAQWPVNEPLAVVPAMAAATKTIGIGTTVSTTYEQPYHLARRLSTIDHLTNGRVGWNVVTGYLESAARNLGRAEQPEHDERYRICEEYMEVMYKLWQSSWKEGSVVHDVKANVYTDPDGVREINHVGKYFQVPGPHICQPSPQRTPVIMQAGTSKSGKAFAAKHAEAIFVSNHSPDASAKAIKEIREQAEKEGRDPRSIKVLAKICPVIGRTQEEAEAKYRDYIQYGSEEGALALFGGWTGVDMAKYGDDEELRYVESNAIRSYIEGLVKYGPKVGTWTKKTLAEHIMVGGLGATPVGTVEYVADEFERWVEEADVDGFNIAYAIMPQTFVDVIELLLPELRRRGIFWDDYTFPGGTYRENLTGIEGQRYPAADHPASGYLWTENKSSTETVKITPASLDKDVLDPMKMQMD